MPGEARLMLSSSGIEMRVDIRERAWDVKGTPVPYERRSAGEGEGEGEVAVRAER